jgi:hypothetical protein
MAYLHRKSGVPILHQTAESSLSPKNKWPVSISHIHMMSEKPMPKSLTYTLSEVIAQSLLSLTPSTYLSNFMHIGT